MGIGHSKRKMSDKKSGNNESGENRSRSNARPLSIEAPKTDGDQGSSNLTVTPNQPRQPHDLQGLLRFAMEATKAEDAPHPSRSVPMDEERKKFISDALSSMTVNVAEELQENINILKGVVDLREGEDPTEFENALERITDFTDSIDIANDFYKVGGFSILGSCLNSPHGSIRWKVAELIAELTQNNPFCQERMLEAGFLPILLNMVDSDEVEMARIKALYAISCMARGHQETLKHVEKFDGYSVLIRAMQSPVEKLQIKSAFLLSALCNRDNDDHLKATLIKMGIIEQAAGLLAMGNLLFETKEQLLSVLNGLTTNQYLPAMRECRRPELCLKMTLERLLNEAIKEDSRDRVDMCKELLDKIFAPEESMQQDR